MRSVCVTNFAALFPRFSCAPRAFFVRRLSLAAGGQEGPDEDLHKWVLVSVN
jgi:hypothetical protein